MFAFGALLVGIALGVAGALAWRHSQWDLERACHKAEVQWLTDEIKRQRILIADNIGQSYGGTTVE